MPDRSIWDVSHGFSADEPLTKYRDIAFDCWSLSRSRATEILSAPGNRAFRGISSFVRAEIIRRRFRSRPSGCFEV